VPGTRTGCPDLSVEPGARSRVLDLHVVRGRDRQEGGARRGDVAALCVCRRRHERQHPDRPVRRRLLVHVGLTAIGGRGDARPGRGKAL
jgi:hypothetical protein